MRIGIRLMVLALVGLAIHTHTSANVCATYSKNYFASNPTTDNQNCNTCCPYWGLGMPPCDKPCWLRADFYCTSDLHDETLPPPVRACSWDGGQAVCNPDPRLCGGIGSTEATCLPPPDEICGNNIDDNCNGLIDENCCNDCKCPVGGQNASNQACRNSAGSDPVNLSNRSVVTEPFTDFSVEHISKLSITRTYVSNDASLVIPSFKPRSSGQFGPGWHHDWEADLTCSGNTCTVGRGLAPGSQFDKSGSALSADETETWDVYSPSKIVGVVGHHAVLVARPTGEWILFQPDGRSLHFASVCDACSGDDASSARCLPVSSGGVARLVKITDRVGNAVTVTYDRPGGILLRLQDELGHSLELHAVDACSSGLARELRYDGSPVATYAYEGGNLKSATDPDGNTLRSYAYYPGAGGRLRAVQNEAGTAIAEFQYDANWLATGVVDATSSVSIQNGSYISSGPYAGSTTITEYFHGANGVTSSTSTRQFNRLAQATAVSGSGSAPPEYLDWTYTGTLRCSSDGLGHVTAQDVDALGRVVHRVSFPGMAFPGTAKPDPGCPIPTPLPPDSREEWTGYRLQQPVAQGFTVSLDTATQTVRSSAMTGGTCRASDAAAFDPTGSLANQPNCVGEYSDYDSTSKSIDPIDPLDLQPYACAPTSLPANSVVCRHISVGYVSGSSGPVIERHATFFKYDTRGRVIRAFGPVNLDRASASDVPPIEERTYWPDDAEYSNRGRLHELKRYATPSSVPLVTTYEYDPFGVYRITAPDNLITMIIKDGRGRTRFTILSRGATALLKYESRYYDGFSPRIQIKPNGAAVRFGYDAKGRLTTTDYLAGDPDAQGATPTVARTEANQYDDAGNRIHSEQRDAHGLVTWQQDREFDVQHHVVREANPAAPTFARTWEYDPSGILARATDEIGRATAFTLDGLNRTARVGRSGLDSSGSPVALDVAVYGYQPGAGGLASVTDGNGATATYSPDDFGRNQRLSTPTLAKSGDVQTFYDARGNVLQRTAGTVTTTLTYDGFDRLLTSKAQDSASGVSIQYTYRYDEQDAQGIGTGIGRLTSIVEPDRTVTYGYDPLGRLQTESIAEAGTVPPLLTSYAYDADGRVTQLSYPSGLVVRYDRDPTTGDVVRVSNASDGSAYADAVQHDPRGNLLSLTFGNGRTFSQVFDLRGQALQVNSGPVSLAYGADGSGDVVTLSDRSETLNGCSRDAVRQFKYDFLDRLADSKGLLSYRYDAAGNRTSEAAEGISATYTYTADRVKERLSGGRRTHAFAYDGSGNLSAIAAYDASGSTVTQAMCLVHDPLARMVAVGNTVPAGVSPDSTSCTSESAMTTVLARFKYDAQNRRVARQLASGGWTYVVSGGRGEPISELSLLSGSWQRGRDYVWLDGRPIVQVEFRGNGAADNYYIHSDAIGLPRALTNQMGQMIWNTVSKPYGDILEKMVTDPLSGRVVVTNLRLPGQYDERLFVSLGLQGPYYNWNRWYLPGVGRYLEPDPIALNGDLNTGYGIDWYEYAWQNPVTYVDPEGAYAVVPPPPTWPLIPAAGVGVAIGWGINQIPGVSNGVQNFLDWAFGAPGDPRNPWYSGPKPEPAPRPQPGPGPGPGGGGPGTGGGCPPREPCYDQYLKATADCGSWYTDDTQYEACMSRAWKNYIRCLNGLPWKQNP